jgi:inosine-uridine nucleoside N-ribohydrolase
MGGALDVPGNTSAVAEFNCYADPFAADQILVGAQAGAFELIMAPLDITTPHQVPFSDLIHSSILAAAAQPGNAEKLANGGGLEGVKTSPTGEHGEPTPIQAFVGAMLLRVRGLQASFGLPDAMEMHDPVAVWYAIAHGGSARLSQTVEKWGLRQRVFKVERVGELTRGMCVVDRRGTGEETGDRTKDEKIGGGGAVPSLEEKKAKKGEVEGEKRLPWVITSTPGVEELRRLILGRVFGIQV